MFQIIIQLQGTLLIQVKDKMNNFLLKYGVDLMLIQKLDLHNANAQS